MRRALSLGILAACGGSPNATTTPVDNGGGTPSAAPPYAALFVDGARWSFTAVATDSHWDDADPAADADGNVKTSSESTVTCSVEKSLRFEGGVVSQIRCEGDTIDGSYDPLQGVWVADAIGLYALGEAEWPVTGLPERAAGQLVLAATPVENSEDGEYEEGSWHKAVTRKGDAWCWSSAQAMGDESWDSVCVDAAGISEATWGWAGGSVHEKVLTRKDDPLHAAGSR